VTWIMETSRFWPRPDPAVGGSVSWPKNEASTSAAAPRDGPGTI
jgi:hypothetical protein